MSQAVALVLFLTNKQGSLMSSIKSKCINLIPLNLYLHLKRFKVFLLQRNNYISLQNRRKEITKDGFTFKSFDETKSIFVHIPKCAGSSISNHLYGNRAGGHMTINDYALVFPPKDINSYFKFTVVRNPWDRVVSAYHFLSNGGMNDTDKRWAEDNIGEYKDFQSFVKGWLNIDNIFKYHHFRPQYLYFMGDNEKLKIDYFAFLENIDDDFEVICKKIGFKSILEQKNQSIHKDYKDYFDEETKLIVATVYEKDIGLLGYSFDNSSIPKQIKERNKLVISNLGE